MAAGCRCRGPARSGRSASALPARANLPGCRSRRRGATTLVEAQESDTGSILALYRDAIALRRRHPALGDGSLRWLEGPEGSLTFARDPGFTSVVNVSSDAVALPEGGEVVLASGPLPGRRRVPPDTAVWLTGSGEAAPAG
jgi:alpha-glucosidase